MGVKGAVCMMVALTTLACAVASVMIGSESKSPPSTAIVGLITSVAVVTAQIIHALPKAVVAVLDSTMTVTHNDFEYAGKVQYQAKLDTAYEEYERINNIISENLMVQRALLVN